MGLFCDLEGHHAGPDGEQFADRGLDRLLGLLDERQLRITFNVVAELCQTHSDRIRRVMDAGHEVACHGWRHERPRDMSSDGIGSMLRNAAECFAELDIRPLGFRSPRSAWSTTLLQQLVAHGYRWNAERDTAAVPYRIKTGLVRVSVTTDDWDLADGSGTTEDLMRKWRLHVDAALQTERVVCIGVHEWIIGRDADYATALDAFLADVCRRQGLQPRTLGEIAVV
ncbi:MAG: polysaccharide deacetylase family protein [Phycisphaerae bacterium]|nr:polysaccharide deacetylase family protein [Phycisphaerae bacterium]